MRIWTPGHNYLTDTLIMWGITSILVVREVLKDYSSVKIIGSGGRYCIELPDLDLNKFNTEFCEYVRDIIDLEGLEQLIKARRRRALGGVVRGTIRDAVDPDTRSGVAKAIYNLISQKIDLSVFTEDHKIKFREGRVGGKGLTLYIPLSGIYGKFATFEHEYKDLRYSVCPACVAFAAIGMNEMAIISRRRTERVYVVFGFDGEVTLDKLAPFIREDWQTVVEDILNRAFRNDASLTALGQAFLVFSNIPEEVRKKMPNVLWYLIIYSYDVGRTKRITGFKPLDLMPIKDLITKIIDIEPNYRYLPGLLRTLIERVSVEKGGDEIINLMAEYSINRDPYLAYKIVRLLRSLIDKLSEQKAAEKRVRQRLFSLLDLSLAEALLSAV